MQGAEVLASELPLEGFRDGCVVTGESMQALVEGVAEGREVVGRQGLALKGGEVDLHLIEPPGMHGRVERHRGRLNRIQEPTRPKDGSSRSKGLSSRRYADDGHRMTAMPEPAKGARQVEDVNV